MEKVLEYIKPEERCWICRIRKATVQCDYEIPTKNFMRNYKDFIEANKGPHTCIKIMCDKCKKQIDGKDYCPEHYIKVWNKKKE